MTIRPDIDATYTPRRRRALPAWAVDTLLCTAAGVLAGVWLCWLGGMA